MPSSRSVPPLLPLYWNWWCRTTQHWCLVPYSYCSDTSASDRKFSKPSSRSVPPPSPILNLVMHNYPTLVSGALHLLFRHFSQRQEVLDACKQVTPDHAQLPPTHILKLIMHNYPPPFPYTETVHAQPPPHPPIYWNWLCTTTPPPFPYTETDYAQLPHTGVLCLTAAIQTLQPATWVLNAFKQVNGTPSSAGVL